MKVPNTIYIDEDLIAYYSLTDRHDGDLEYIRKDALLEWAKGKNQRIDTDEGDYSLGYVSAMIDLIDKINSL